MLLSHVLLSHSIPSSGARLGRASVHGEPPLAILLMIFMTTQEPSKQGQREDCTDFHEDLSQAWTGSEHWHTTLSMYIFLEDQCAKSSLFLALFLDLPIFSLQFVLTIAITLKQKVAKNREGLGDFHHVSDVRWM